LVALVRRRKADTEKATKVQQRETAEQVAQTRQQQDEEATAYINHKKQSLVFSWPWTSAGHSAAIRYPNVDKFVDALLLGNAKTYKEPIIIEKARNRKCNPLGFVSAGGPQTTVRQKCQV
jgi:hypothetical protein